MPELVVTNSAFAEHDDRTCLLLRLYRRQQSYGAYGGTYVRWEPSGAWEKAIAGLGFLEPAKPFTLECIGIADQLSQNPVRMYGKNLVVLSARKWLERLLKRKTDLRGLLARNTGAKKNLGFQTDFGGLEILELPSSRWFFAEKVPVKPTERKRARIIF